MVEELKQQMSLDIAAARTLTTTTKSVPQMQEITSRWLLRILPWVQVSGGTYRVNRRMSYALGDGLLTFTSNGTHVRVIPGELMELPWLQGLDDADLLNTLADRFVQQEFESGEMIVQANQPADRIVLIAYGKANKLGTGKYGDQTVLEMLADGEYFGSPSLLAGNWPYTVQAATHCTVLSLPSHTLQELLNQSPKLRAQVELAQETAQKPQNRYGEAAIDLASGHEGEPDLPGTFVDYDDSPREYSLSVAQTVLRVHTRVADLYNEPMNQVEQQLRLTIEALRERQEHELINNREFGLLHNVDRKQLLQTRVGPPTPDDFDEMLALVRDAGAFFAHPRAIAAFGKECNRLGLYPQTLSIHGGTVPSWRGLPIFPCNKIPVTEANSSSILVMRTGEENQGVIGLHQIGIPDEYQPGLSVRFMGINEKAIISYLVSAYYSAAILVPDALAILENVEIGRS
ncbi:Crp/Fnr family transcriptional regulator [Reticulibacter mediterranei]|uniref:Crp/Fnr family transcriptional regulator n=1 Tax=Reticulibacter mediterranei TaxID=2778369 RepID=A0A8J3IQR2_9CHLR|nr:family 2B encapsulin nanocompartment shell protein [Reticulibacter mediterranei]GHO94576.1 Crp/Fnr family transcriptional regulator [Reticulibacter mediterranei]